MKISELYVGQSCTLSKRFSFDDVRLFSELSMDNNPIHLDEEYAAKSPFGSRLVHGFLTGSLFSAIIGTLLPGNGSVYLSQTMNFRKPIMHNQLVTAKVTITKIRKDKPIVTLETICVNDKNEIVIDGIALVKLYS